MNPAQPSAFQRYRRFIFGGLGLSLAWIVFLLVPRAPFADAPAMAAVVTLMAIWWIFEVVPIAVTSILPIVLFPLLGIMKVEATTALYGKSTIFLFLGGFILALGLQVSNVHKRMALRIVSLVGSKPTRLVLGFMVATAFMSMWISNTATVMVMLPIALSILEQAKSSGVDEKPMRNFGLSVMLGIAYSADMGGMATLIGTAPNMAFRTLLTQIFPDAPDPGFVPWMMMGLPLAIVFVFLGWLLLTRLIFPVRVGNLLGGQDIIRDNLRALGGMRRDEVMAISVFGLAALLWMTGGDIEFGESFTFLGWRGRLGLQEVNDAVVAVGAACLLFMVPSGDRPGEPLMRWDMALKVPWGILLLFGGGFAIAGGFSASGLSSLVGQTFAEFAVDSPVILVILICFVLTFLTEITSNTATTNLILPILANAGVALNIDPRILMIPATLSASCAFMMPVASPTQAIVFGSGYVKIRQMIFAGIWFNLLGIILVTAVFLLLANVVWGIDLGVMPDWAK
ncbi:MAG TPA: DASS family sodium-coupled anion symporter [Bacteroidetes bacterium]|nr:DASS family sodium-coupled anion symporter [Bacteroidota bacterium]